MKTDSVAYKYWFNTLFMGQRIDGTVDSYRSQNKFSKLVVITGTVGNRSDLLAGWIADTHAQKFNTVNWHMFPASGKSQIHHAIKWPLIQDVGDRMYQSIEQGRSNNDLDIIKHILNNFADNNHDTAAKWVMTKSHYTSWFLAHAIPREHWDKFLVIDLLVNDTESVRRVLWERFVKNILWSIKTSIDQIQSENSEVADQLLARQLGKKEAQAVIAEAEKYYHNTLIPAITHASPEVLGNKNHNQKTDLLDFPATVVDYREIMQPGGISDLLQTLDLGVDTASGWDKIYPLAQSPDQVFAGGRYWINPVA